MSYELDEDKLTISSELDIDDTVEALNKELRDDKNYFTQYVHFDGSIKRIEMDAPFNSYDDGVNTTIFKFIKK